MGKTAMQLQNYNFHNINKDSAVPPVAALKIKPNPSFAKDFTELAHKENETGEILAIHSLNLVAKYVSVMIFAYNIR